MTLRFYKNATEKYWFDVDTLEIEGQKGRFHEHWSHNPARSELPIPQMMFRAADKTSFKSPVDREVIDSHWKRREHMKKHNLREVDSTEHKPLYRNPNFRKKHNISDDRAGDEIVREARKADPISPHIQKQLNEKLAKGTGKRVG